jgi:hypothetical protein
MRKLYAKTWYTPREIARLGLIKSPKSPEDETSSYVYVLGLIQSGKLKFKNYGKGQRPYYLVSETEIAKYHEAEL